MTYEFYIKLYKDEESISKDKILLCLQKADLPKVLEEVQNILNKDITLQEITEAIKKQKSNKTPGPDGLPSEIYKNFEECLGPILLDVFNEVLKTAKIPTSWEEAIITLIPKGRKYLDEAKNG